MTLVIMKQALIAACIFQSILTQKTYIHTVSRGNYGLYVDIHLAVQE